MPIFQQGQINLSALSVPDAYIQIVPPQYLFAGVSTNIGGFVGTASWGPTNSAQRFAGYTQYATIFGPTVNRFNDMGGHVFLAAAQGGAGSLVGVRVSDGTDVAASYVLTSAGTAITFTGKYTGSLGNSVKVTLSQGSQAGLAVAASDSVSFTTNPAVSSTLTVNGTAFTFVASGATGAQVNIGANLAATLANAVPVITAQVATVRTSANGSQLLFSASTPGTGGNAYTLATTVSGATVAGATFTGGAAATVTYKVVTQIPGQFPETFDNIGLGLTGNAIWVAIATAINNGNSTVRGPSGVILATAGAGMGPVLPGTYQLSGGTDGVTSITTSIMLGVDTLPRTGMYVLRGTNVAQAILCDLADVNSFSTQVAFGADIGCYMIGTTASGDTINNAVTELGNAGIDNFTMKVMFGDWLYFIDTTNNVPLRLISPQGAVLGKLCNLSPQNSSLNKPIQGIVGTQKSLTGIQYSSSDLQALASAQMDVIANPEPGGNYFACRFGKNTSSSPVIFGDEYTRVTYFLAKSLLIIAGQFVGMTQTVTERFQAKTALQQFLQVQVINGIIGTPDGSQAYQVVLDNTNNTQTTVALGYQYAYIKAIYLGIVRYFVVNLEGGASVTISNTPPQQ